MRYKKGERLRKAPHGGWGEREENDGTSDHGDSARSYTPAPGDPSFKFWTHETMYPLEHLREPTVSPQTKWG